VIASAFCWPWTTSWFIPPGLVLFERIVVDGPAASVGVVAVIRNLPCLEGSQLLLQALADSRTVLCFGRDERAAWERIRGHYRTHDRP
jgi:hypothetical protein